MNSRPVALSFISIALILASCSSSPAHTGYSLLPPGHMFNGPYLNIRSPNSEGWHLVASNPSNVIFAKDGPTKGESFVASIPIFPLTDTTSSEELMATVRNIVETDEAPPHITTNRTQYEITSERSYPCVRVTSDLTDNEAETGLGKNEKLLMQNKGLYCSHPTLGKTGFGMQFSFRGREPYPNFDAEANDFINGVQVPGH